MEPHERLKAARIKAGYETAQAAAEAFGWNPVTYRAHEAGQNKLRPLVAERYARALGVTASWLLYGEGDKAAAPHEAEFINLLRRMPERKRESLLDIARSIVREEKS